VTGTKVAQFSSIRPGEPVKVLVDDVAVVLVRLGDDVYALADTCSHEEASLSEGEVYEDEREIECPLHGSTFVLDSGEPTCLPATQPVNVYTVTVEDDDVLVERRDA